ncbi:MAG: chemotaxis protein CheW [Firmicutes bacterium]|nr:chemotaxis protein CheW [Bacillota bacterium]
MAQSVPVHGPAQQPAQSPPRTLGAAQEEVQLVVFQLGDELYGAEIQAVREVVRAQEYRITPVPRTPAYLLGVTNLRGRVIPVIDLRRRLGQPPAPLTGASRIAVLEGELGTVGMVVDGVSEVVRVPVGSIEPPSPVMVRRDGDFVRGVARMGERLIILLDLGAVLAREDRKSRIEGGRHAAGV